MDHNNCGRLAQVDIQVGGGGDRASARTARIAPTLSLPPPYFYVDLCWVAIVLLVCNTV